MDDLLSLLEHLAILPHKAILHRTVGQQIVHVTLYRLIGHGDWHTEGKHFVNVGIDKVVVLTVKQVG